MKILLLDIAWLAGLLEGEGSFGFQRSGKYLGTPVIRLQMTDKDVVERAAALLGGKFYGPHGPYGQSKLPTYQTQAHGSRAIGWMMTLYSLLGVRRRVAVERTIATWKTMQTILPTRKLICHSERKYFAKDLCRPCYMKNYHARA